MFQLLDPSLYPREAGSVIVPEAVLERKLGRAAFLVWQILSVRRDAHCLTYAKRKTIGTAKGFEKLPDRAVKKALGRLCDSGLVVNLQAKRRRATLPSGEVGWVFPRKVYGARVRVSGSSKRSVLVPVKTYYWLKGASSWGGHRAGAGRKKIIKRGHTFCNQEGPRIDLDLDHLSNIQNSRAGRVLLRNTLPARAADAPRSGSKHSSTPGPEVMLMSHKMETPFELSLGLSLGGNFSRPRIPQPGQMGMPSYPGPTVMPPAMVPRPPKLPEDIGDLALADWLASCYRGAVRSRYGKCHVLRSRTSLAKSRFFKILVSGGRTLADYDISPAAWAAFSVGVWRRHEQAGSKQPPINWMFAPTRIEERRKWFEEEEGAYNGGRLVYGDSATKLMHLYVRMQGALTWAQARTETQVKAVVDRFFPDGLYDDLLMQARKEAQDKQREMNDAVARGEWVWG